MKRIVGGFLLFFIGVLLNYNQTLGKIDLTTNPTVSAVGGLSIIIGILQIRDRYEIAKEGINKVRYGKNYNTQKWLEKIILGAANEIDELHKKEIIKKAEVEIKKTQGQWRVG